jgi:hypothetical protein
MGRVAGVGRESPATGGGEARGEGSDRSRRARAHPAPLLPPQNVGYTAEDSAGQSNIFAVEPKQYVAGSARDTVSAGVAVPNTVYAVTAAVVGVALIAAGVSLAPRGGDGVGFDPALGRVSEYAGRFEGRAAAPAPAAAPALVE